MSNQSFLLTRPCPSTDPLLLTDDELRARPRYTRMTRFMELSPLTIPDDDRANAREAEELFAGIVFTLASWFEPPDDDEIEAAAAEPLLSLVEVFVPPDDSYDVLDLDPDLYGYGPLPTEAETMRAPLPTWDAQSEAA